MSDKRRRTRLGVAIAVAVGSAICLMAPQASADDDANKILQAMSDYLASQKTISLTLDTSVEVITPVLEKVQFASSGTVLMSRPDKLHATSTGGNGDVELFFDGKTLAVYGKNVNGFVQLPAPGSIDDMVKTLRAHSIAVPGADLLLSNVFEQLMSQVIESKHLGFGVVGGVKCDHLAFRNSDVDWQLWVEAGPNPIPRKYVITSKAMGEAPQYTLLIRDWKTDAQADAAAFEFKPPAGAQKLNEDALESLVGGPR
jgi:hypothetical protein